ncbi:hypothetical protein K450DRAFT_252108 [Umbelopsis ramanniana AG]|uniref:Exonuclease domain-containing protein n=1 Tax=Umbelopsis ramanniana AG TaxID=1314678 RepID=A0AAD5E6T6_UMBRA|nr:uncharacterized protein K450DRAFT_252108 [Umbelopsis ramanniana AG]KAI8577361.1 hypothetical protein K450DRAFT_252108 [Umbelopsis ramanniana AG]
MPKFTPRVEAKNPVLHDVTTKKHITFDLSDSETEKPVAKRAKLDKPKAAKKPKEVKKKMIQIDQKITVEEIKVDHGVKVINASVEAKKKASAKATTAAETTVDGVLQDQILLKVQKRRQKLKEKKKAKKNGVATPTLEVVPEELTKRLGMEDIREYILYCLAEAPVPSWLKIANRAAVQKLVLVYAQGLDLTYFGYPESRANIKPIAALNEMEEQALAKKTLKFFTSQFSHCVVSKSSGTKGKVHNPMTNLLQCPVSHSQKEKRDKQRASNREAFNTADHYILKLEDMIAAEYPIPTSLDSTSVLPEGWHETRPGKEPTPKKLIAVDCEMCETASGMALTRVSLIDEDSNVILDELVVPDEPITNYLTEYSGITPDMMAGVTTSLRRAQKHVRKFVDHNVILVGHGLHNDLNALKLTHPYCIDTSIIYHHSRGPPFRPGLKWLATRYLKRDIQNTDPNHGGRIGHDPREDATATLDLVKLKIQRGEAFGLLHDDTELIFNRMKRFRPPRFGAIVESCEKLNKLLSAALGKDYFHCISDEEAVQKTIETLADHDFVLSKWSDLEGIRKKDTDNSYNNGIPSVVTATSGETVSSELTKAMDHLSKFDEQFKSLYDQLPDNTAIIVMGGLGDVRAVQRLQEKQDSYQAMFKKYKLSDIPESDQFTEKDQKRLEQEAAKAQMGSTFFCIKGSQE